VKRYRKFIVALIGTAVTIASTLPLPAKWAALVASIVSLLTAIGVYRVPNA
jgi:hypothetical protein